MANSKMAANLPVFFGKYVISAGFLKFIDYIAKEVKQGLLASMLIEWFLLPENPAASI